MPQWFDVRPSVLYENRYCEQNEFDILVNHENRESKDHTNSVIQIESADVKCDVVLIPMSVNRCFAETAVNGSDIFVLSGHKKIVKKSSCVVFGSMSPWKNLTSMPDSRIYFSVCSFMKSIYLIGGYFSADRSYSKGCYKYEIIHNKWTKMTDLNIKRCKSACVVFEGQVVATRGNNRYNGRTKSAESYDHYEKKWNHLPDMIGLRGYHSSFSMGNKFFVIGGYSNVDAEVFDSTSRKFTLFNIKLLCKKEIPCRCETVNFGRKMFVFCNCSLNRQPKLHVYNVDEKKWDFKIIIKNDRFVYPIIHKVPKQ